MDITCYFGKSNYPNLHQFWGINEYYRDHLQVLLEREQRRKPFGFTAPEIQYRPTLVEWMKKIAILKRLDNGSIHLSIYMLDTFMDQHRIVAERLHLVALVCMLLASKVEAIDTNILKVSELSKLVENKFPLSDYHVLEILIFKYFNWNLFLPTSVHFINCYIEILISEEDLIGLNYTCRSDLYQEAKIIVQDYLDCILEDIALMQCKPSLVAASIIALARLQLRMQTIWPENLATLTGYKLFELKSTVLLLKQRMKSSEVKQ